MNPTLIAETEALSRTLARRKTVSESQYLSTTMRVIGGYGTNGPKSRPYKQELSVRWFSGLVYALTMLNAKAFAKVPIRLYTKAKPRRPDMKKVWNTRPLSRGQKAWVFGRKHANSQHSPSKWVQQKAAEYGEVEEVVDSHPVTELLRTANQWQNGFELSVLRSIQIQVTGNAYLWPEMDPRLGRPSQLWLVPSQYTKVIPSTQGRYLDGYIYGPPQDPRRFGPDELINFKMPGIDPMALYGTGLVEAAWEALNLRKGERMNAQAMYDNGARPDYAIIFKQGASIPDMDRVDAAIDGKFRGAGKAGQFMTLSGDVAIQPLQWSPKDIGSNEDVESEICAIWGTPISKIRSSDPNRANASISDESWQRDSILPSLRFDEEQLNARYVPLFPEVEDAFLCYDDPVPENEGETREGVISEFTSGLTSRAEARAELGRDAPAEDFIVLPKGTTALKIDESGNVGDPLYEPEPAQSANDGPPPKKNP